MELDIEKVNSALEKMANPIDKIFFYRLSKKLERLENVEEDFNMLRVHREYLKISDKFTIVINHSLIGDEFKERIVKHYELLKYLLNSADIDDVEKSANLKRELIYLECMLDLPIHYPLTAKRMLDDILNSQVSLKRDKHE